MLFSCSNKNLDPTEEQQEIQTDLNITIGYLNDDFSSSKAPTDIIALKYEGIPEGFDMITQTLDNSDTRVILLDNKSQSTAAYDYKKDTDFSYSAYMHREETKTWVL